MWNSGGIIQRGPEWSLGSLGVAVALVSVGAVLIVLARVDAIDWVWPKGFLVATFLLAAVMAMRYAVSPSDTRV